MRETQRIAALADLGRVDHAYDRFGVPILAGDLLKTFHFRDPTRRGKRRWLYHVAVADGECLRGVPVEYLDSSIKRSGGEYSLRGQQLATEVISCAGGEEYPDERRRIVAKDEA